MLTAYGEIQFYTKMKKQTSCLRGTLDEFPKFWESKNRFIKKYTTIGYK